MSADIAERELTKRLAPNGMATVIEEANDALVMATSVEDVAKVLNFSAVAEGYARARGMREHAQEAGVLRVRAERAAGAMRAQLPKVSGGANPRRFDHEEARRLLDSGLTCAEVARRLGVSKGAIYSAKHRGWVDPPAQKGYPLKKFDEELEIDRRTGATWERLAGVPADDFEAALLQMRASDARFAAAGVLRRVDLEDNLVEPCIYRLTDGRLRIRWTRDKTARSKTLGTRDLVEARKVLARVRGKIPAGMGPGKGTPNLSSASGLTTAAARIVGDWPTKGMRPDQRDALNRASRALYAAEDAVVQLVNLL